MRVAVRVTGLAVAAAGLVAAAIGWQPRGVQAQSGPAPNTVAFYNQRVQPILSNNCYRCHGGENHRGRLHMDTRAEFLAGGRDGAVIVPGHPEPVSYTHLDVYKRQGGGRAAGAGRSARDRSLA